MWTFRTPFVNEGPATWTDPLFIRVGLNRGISILETSPGVYVRHRWPTQDELRAAIRYFLGGFEYEVDDATKAALMAADIGVTENNFATPEDSYGGGSYGAGAYGE